ncbi:MAG TPA: dihydrolipoyl dehydrogenase [Marinilabiliaceae bacterium]|nr:dihydrolipoyl dehydrogenase [Marinilabiliaceae bacterium]
MDYDLIIIGAGPAGYVAAIRAGQLGLKTAIVEKKHIGGMCLNWGCIPSKTILESAKVFEKTKQLSEFGVDGIDLENVSFNWDTVKKRSKKITKKLTAGVDFLLKKNGIEVINGTATIGKNKTVYVDGKKITAENIIVATGSKPKKLNDKLEDAPSIEMENLFDLEEIPEKIVVTGNHVSAVEIAQFFKLIDKKVTLVANSEYFLDGIDKFLIDYITKNVTSNGIELISEGYPSKYSNGKLTVGDKKIECDLLVNCSSRKAIIPESETPFELTERGFIKTDKDFKTNIVGVYVIGDAAGKSFVAHMASAQGIHVVNAIKGVKANFDYSTYPINMYTSPEISQIGMTEEMIREEGYEYKVNEFPLSANAKAMIEGNTEGFIRMLSEKKYGQVLGVQIVGKHATDMIAEAGAYLKVEGTVYDVANTIHAHPTVSEIYFEVGFDAFDKAIHI